MSEKKSTLWSLKFILGKNILIPKGVMTETILITVYRIVDDFINAVLKTQSGREVCKSWLGSRGPKPHLALVEIITPSSFTNEKPCRFR
jgi:hypothetical protein